MKRRLFFRALSPLALVAVLLAAMSATAPSASAAVTACQVVYTVQNDWGAGFTTNVHVANLGDPVNGWTLTFSFAGNQRLTQGWSATWTQAAGSSNVSAVNAPWNGSLGSGAATDIGFNAAYSGSNVAPTAFALNGVACTGPNQPPTVALTNPAPGATFTAPATIPLAANASDPNGTVAQVDFLIGTTAIGSDTTAPYTFTWTAVPAGSYSLTARATDNGGASTVSAPVGVTVQPNTGPSVLASPASVTVPEGGTATFGVRLSAQPSANVIVTVARTAGDTDLTVSAGASLTFTTANWNVAQNVTLAAAQDADQAAGTATFTASAAGHTAARVTATEADDDQPVYTQRFLDLYGKIKDPANGYFSPQGIPYHSVETLIVEAPDYGHETTSEAFSYWLWLEATYGQVTRDWTRFNNAWATMEQFIIPSHADQPTNSFYNASKPATYAPELDLPSQYPSPLDASVPVGQDPLAGELQSTYGTPDVYGMHWMLDVDNRYGFGHCGDGTTKPAYINTFQRGSQESVWETIPQPDCDTFADGGPNGFLDLFVGDSSYARQWKYTDAPDADARAVQAAYWALTWATAQGNQAQISATVAKAAKMGDYLRYSMFDKYFKQQGNCTDPSTCPGATGRGSSDFLLGWYYAWGGALDTSAGWAWRIGDGTAHFGYQNPLAAWALSNVPALEPRSPTATSDWSTSLGRQLQFYGWLQSAEGAIAGGATNSWGGHYGVPPAGLPTFFGMAYDFQPVYHDPPSNEWFGFQAWSMERVAEYYFATGDARAKAVLDKWVGWAVANTTINANGTFQIPSKMTWSGQPAASFSGTGTPAANPGLHVTILESSQDVGVAAALAKTLAFYAAKSGSASAKATAKGLLDALWSSNYQDAKGVSSSETRTDFNRFDDPVFVPQSFSGTMPNGDAIHPGSTFESIRSWYTSDPDWPKVQSYLAGGPAPTFRYHRFWAQSDIATAEASFGILFPSG
jgi:hypothetical protein